MVLISRIWRLAAGGMVMAAALAAGGCATSSNTGTSNVQPLARADTPAATLRERIDNLLQEHVTLASAATGAAIASRNEEFTAAANALDSNSQELASAIGAICGSDAQNTLLKMWRNQAGYLMDYTQGVVSSDDVRKDNAKISLNNSADLIATYLEKMTNGRLKKEVLAELIKGHVSIMADVIAAQSAKDYVTAYNKTRDAEHQILNIGDPLADALVDEHPDKFEAF